jgi:hypothetical protein
LLGFAISVRHPDSSTDYRRVEALLRRTIGSVTNQDRPDFVVAVAANRLLPFEVPSSVRPVVVDFPPPTAVPTPRVPRDAALSDKGSKLAVAVLAAREAGADHVMVVDADDFVSRRLAGFVADAPLRTGWYVDEGYLYGEGTGLVRRMSGFVHTCGTSLIYGKPFLDALPDLPVTATKEQLLDGLGAFTVHELLGSHKRAVEHYASLGTPLAPVPFPAAVYTVGTGENLSERSLDRMAFPVTRRFTAEFGLPTSSNDPAALLRAGRQAATAVAGRVARLRR